MLRKLLALTAYVWHTAQFCAVLAAIAITAMPAPWFKITSDQQHDIRMVWAGICVTVMISMINQRIDRKLQRL